MEGGSALTLRDLGVSSQEFSGRLFRTGFDLLMPPDFYAADYGKMTLHIDAGYAAGLAKGSQLLVRVNDKDAASLPLPNPDGDVFRDRPVTVPLSHLRPGFNHVQIEAQVPTTADKQCDAAATIAGQRRFVLLDDTTLELPSIARIAHLPSLAVTAASGFPYTRAQSGVLYLPHPDAATVAAAATFLSRLSGAAGAPLGLEVLVGKPPSDGRPAIVIGGFKDIPPGILQAAGLNAAAMRDTWANVEASAAAVLRLRQVRGSGRPAIEPLLERHDGATLFRQWSDDVSAGHWRFDPVKMVSEALRSGGRRCERLAGWRDALRGRPRRPHCASPTCAAATSGRDPHRADRAIGRRTGGLRARLDGGLPAGTSSTVGSRRSTRTRGRSTSCSPAKAGSFRRRRCRPAIFA